jgi:2-oxoglutarate dehydrogenase E2 component (dihydrolipoamide succinyltransferase)
MLVEIKVPSVGESVTEAILAEWFKKDGDRVRKGEALYVIETDKVTLEVEAEAEGVLKIGVAEGETVAIGAVVGTLDTAAVAEAAPESEPESKAAEEPTEEAREPEDVAGETSATPPVLEEPPVKAETVEPQPEKGEAMPEDVVLPPAVRRLVKEKGIDVGALSGSGPGGRITKGDVVLYLEARGAGNAVPKGGVAAEPVVEAPATESETSRKPMTPIRQRIAARLLEARQNTAMLTTFNDIDMSQVMSIRSRYKDVFQKKYDVSLGFMSFFIKATVEALKELPEINAFIDGKDIVYNHRYHIGVAIGTGRGLVVPVIRNAETLSMAQMEKAIVDYVKKIKENRLDLADLEGGTFTITNGGVFGSLLSTPILNTPQSGILGMHRIEKRPIVLDDEIVVRPMMYVALSYDHRIVDGREAVTFLRRIKEYVETPERMLMEI